MFSSKSAVSNSQVAIDGVADTAVQWAGEAADAALRTRDAASDALGQAEKSLRGLSDRVLPAARELKAQAQDIAARGIDAARYGGRQVRDVAVSAAERGTRYVRDEPVKAVAIAALAGVAVYAIVRALNQSRFGR